MDGRLFFEVLLKLISSWELLVVPYFLWFLIIFIVYVLHIGFGTDRSFMTLPVFVISSPLVPLGAETLR